MVSRTLPVFAAFVMIISTACAGGKGEIAPKKAADMMKEKNVVVLDVRTTDEFVQGHIEGSKHYDVHDDAFVKKVSKLKKSNTYIVCCLSGARSARAAQKMRDAGFTKVYNLAGGLQNWVSQGYPIVL